MALRKHVILRCFAKRGLEGRTVLIQPSTDRLERMRIVITGGCGFLGRRVAIRLLEQGSALGEVDELVLFDNAAPALPLPADRRIKLVTGDIADRDTVRRLIAPDGAKSDT